MARIRRRWAHLSSIIVALVPKAMRSFIRNKEPRRSITRRNCSATAWTASFSTLDHRALSGASGSHVPLALPGPAAAFEGLAVRGHRYLVFEAVAAHGVVAARIGEVDGKARSLVAAAVEARPRVGAGDADLLVPVIAGIVDP